MRTGVGADDGTLHDSRAVPMIRSAGLFAVVLGLQERAVVDEEDPL